MQPVIGELDMITDGEKSGGDGYFVELGPVRSGCRSIWARRALSAILTWHYHSQARIYRDVMVLVSDDPAFKTGVTTVFNNDHDNSSKMTAGKDKSTSRSPRASCSTRRCEGPLRAALVERQHDERSQPLRRSRGLRLAK